jgi:hypothetical protein
MEASLGRGEEKSTGTEEFVEKVSEASIGRGEETMVGDKQPEVISSTRGSFPDAVREKSTGTEGFVDKESVGNVTGWSINSGSSGSDTQWSRGTGASTGG